MRSLWVLLLATATAVAAPPSAERTFEPVGVCDLAGEAPTCWTLDGQPNELLLREIKARTALRDSFLSFKPNRKNRFLIVRSQPYVQFRSTDAQTPFFYFRLGRDGIPLDAFRLDYNPKISEGELELAVQTASEPHIDIPARAGSTGKIGEIRIEIGKSELNLGADSYGFSPAARWRFLIGRSKSGERLFQIQAFGRDGKPIEYVDVEGKPVETKKAAQMAEEDLAHLNDPMRPLRIYIPVLQADTRNNVFALFTNIDPDSIGKFRFWTVNERQEKIGPFRLDPVVSPATDSGSR